MIKYAYSTSYQDDFGRGVAAFKRPQSAGKVEHMGRANGVMKELEGDGEVDAGSHMATRPQTAGAVEGRRYNKKSKEACKGRPPGWHSNYRQFLITGCPHHPNESLFGT